MSHDLSDLLIDAVERGRDSWGAIGQTGGIRLVGQYQRDDDAWAFGHFAIGNTRAEPTTEHVPDKDPDCDVQPFETGDLVVAHNGTIANDRELAPDGYETSARTQIDTARWAAAAALDPTPEGVLALLDRTVGSYGVAVGHREQGWVLLATNYKPLYVRQIAGVIEWTSVNPRKQTFLDKLESGWQALPAYSALLLRPQRMPEWIDRSPQAASNALVVCSGGLDSTVAATLARQQYEEIDLLHFVYGCRAQAREIAAVDEIAMRLRCGVYMVNVADVFEQIGHSRLTGTWDGVADGESGAEFAHEWVPARNLIMLSIAVGVAEGHGYGTVVLGNNLEEAGAYPDNEQEFIARLNDVMPYAVAADKHVTISEPVGHLVKHEIVQLGVEIGAPLDATWSCYDANDKHCGTCGPCYMRRTAFAMLGHDDPIAYLTD